MYHSITINGKNTWTDWNLIPASRPIVAAPEANTNYIDIPGRDGSIDISDVASGYPTYKRRTGEWQFIIVKDHYNWSEFFSELMAELHSKVSTVILEDDPDYYYEGRITFKGWETGDSRSAVTIGYDLMPYKMKNTETLKSGSSSSNGSTTIALEKSCKRVLPQITVSFVHNEPEPDPEAEQPPAEPPENPPAPSVTITIGGKTVTYTESGTYNPDNLIIGPDTAQATFECSNMSEEGYDTVTVSIKYRGGML